MLRTALLWAALIVALGARPGLVARAGDKTPTPDKLIDLLGSDDFTRKVGAWRIFTCDLSFRQA